MRRAPVRFLACALLALACFQGVQSAALAERQPDWEVAPEKQEFVLYGSRKSDKFHQPGCRYVRQIKPGNSVGFRSRQEAVDAGYVPCKVCRP